ncbi:tetratricopeptide repeat protein [Saccharothrix sp. S26]|uniref:tetratricopeptide repeat protein n=1 Tax=Saccharothrix sp. S26 TaxID=2907215 RepID=UPI001F1D14B1|nr:tetratricopeptide repeat protein [Saccharothrix sp. S26]MCE6999864.1 tetratricopeptide repeat protein [Saccharothrix sp. S26]
MRSRPALFESDLTRRRITTPAGTFDAVRPVPPPAARRAGVRDRVAPPAAGAGRLRPQAARAGLRAAPDPVRRKPRPRPPAGRDTAPARSPLARAGNDDESLAVLTLQGRALQDLGAHEQARSVPTRALAITDGRPPDIRTALLRRALGTTLVSSGLLEDATRARSTALMHAEAALGRDSPVVGAVLAELGDVLRRRDLLDRARLFLERAVTVLEAAHGPDHPATATARRALAALPHHDGHGA